MKREKKGFTITELLAVIVIIGIIGTIGVTSYNKVKSNVLEKQYANEIDYILTYANNYASDEGISDVEYITVNDLIKKGYLNADDSDGNIYNPINKANTLNCYIIKIEYQNGDYKTSIEDDTNSTKGKTCPSNVLVDAKIKITCNKEDCSNDFYNEDITLGVETTENSLLPNDILTNSKITWSSANGSNGDNSYTIKVPDNSNFDQTYTVTLKYNGNDNNYKGKTYKASQRIKIDKKAPDIISTSINTNYNNEDQLLKVNASDINGSGISGYALINGNESCKTTSYQDANEIKLTSAGNYNLCLKDNAGNITNKKIEIKSLKYNYDNNLVTLYQLNDSTFKLFIPTKNGYTFAGWKDANNKYVTLDSTYPEEVYATWNFNDLSLPVSVYDISEAGKKIENKVNIILDLDTSGSMGGQKIGSLKSCVNELIDSITFDAGSTISIIPFTETASISISAGTDSSNAHSVVNSLDASGGTNFYNALGATKKIIENNKFEDKNTYVIFVSDGYDNYSTSNITSIVSEVHKHAKVYSIGIGTTVDDRLKSIVATDSSYYYASGSDLSSMKEIFSKIQEAIAKDSQPKTVGGMLSVPNIIIDEQHPLIFNKNGNEKKYINISDTKEFLNNNIIDLSIIDKLLSYNGDFSDVSITYYKEGSEK